MSNIKTLSINFFDIINIGTKISGIIIFNINTSNTSIAGIRTLNIKLIWLQIP